MRVFIKFEQKNEGQTFRCFLISAEFLSVVKPAASARPCLTIMIAEHTKKGRVLIIRRAGILP